MALDSARGGVSGDLWCSMLLLLLLLLFLLQLGLQEDRLAAARPRTSCWALATPPLPGLAPCSRALRKLMLKLLCYCYVSSCSCCCPSGGAACPPQQHATAAVAAAALLWLQRWGAEGTPRRLLL